MPKFKFGTKYAQIKINNYISKMRKISRTVEVYYIRKVALSNNCLHLSGLSAENRMSHGRCLLHKKGCIVKQLHTFVVCLQKIGFCKISRKVEVYYIRKVALSNNCLHLSGLSAENRTNRTKSGQVYLVNMPVPQNTGVNIAKSAKIIENSLKMPK